MALTFNGNPSYILADWHYNKKLWFARCDQSKQRVESFDFVDPLAADPDDQRLQLVIRSCCMDLTGLLLVMFGGALGSGARYAAEVIWPYDPVVDELPTTILTVNITGSLIAGFILGLSSIGGPLFEAQRVNLFLATGLLGAFTTFSAFSTQTVEMLADGEPFLAMAYAWTTVTICVLAAGLGYAVGRAV